MPLSSKLIYIYIYVCVYVCTSFLTYHNNRASTQDQRRISLSALAHSVWCVWLGHHLMQYNAVRQQRMGLRLVINAFDWAEIKTFSQVTFLGRKRSVRISRNSKKTKVWVWVCVYGCTRVCVRVFVWYLEHRTRYDLSALPTSDKPMWI